MKTRSKEMIKINQEKLYEVSYLRDPNISAKAKGLLTYLRAMPESINPTLKLLTSEFKDGKASIRGGLKELEDHGYIEIEKESNYKYLLNYHERNKQNNKQKFSDKGVLRVLEIYIKQGFMFGNFKNLYLYMKEENLKTIEITDVRYCFDSIFGKGIYTIEQIKQIVESH